MYLVFLKYVLYLQIDREALSLPVANSQWYTSSLTPIHSTPTSDKESINSSSAPITSSIVGPVFELTEEVSKRKF